MMVAPMPMTTALVKSSISDDTVYLMRSGAQIDDLQ
jgi:hypothetical protein